jgi:ribonuclease HI
VELVIHVDGGARGNPGPAGAGVVIREAQGDTLFEAAYFLGRQTNNVAEYTALIRALERTRDLDADSVTVHSDSELLVRQITGEYRVKNPRLAELYGQVQRLLLNMPRWTIRHVRREANRRADELANLAMDQAHDVLVYDAATGEQPPASPTEPDDDAPADVTVEEEPVTASPDPDSLRVRVRVATAPDASFCPAGNMKARSFVVGPTLPAGLCVHAAHAILPTVLGMLNTEPQEFATVPTLTVRCAHPGCGAVFQLTPEE